MINNLKSLLLIPLVAFCLTSCNYGYTMQKVTYENTFSPWPTGVDYSKFINCSDSFFSCTYQYTYEYCLIFKDGTVIKHQGAYEYGDETFYLLNENGVIEKILKQGSYYRYIEEIEYNGNSYNLVWHAKYI